MERTYTSAGISRMGNKYKLVYTSRPASHIKRLYNEGASDVVLVRLPMPMSKLGATRHLLSHSKFSDISIRSVIEDKLNRLTPNLPTEPVASGDVKMTTDTPT